MYTYTIRENPESDGVTLFFAKDELPAQPISDYSDMHAAMRAHSDLAWSAPDEDDGSPWWSLSIDDAEALCAALRRAIVDARRERS